MRRASAAHNPGVSLFPFLAVLICTMGVMMLLLVIINRPGAAAIDDSEPPHGAVFEEGGKGSAATIASGNGGASSAANDELQGAKEMVQWRISQLEISREKTVGDLRDERLRLSTVEDGMRKLRDQWELAKKAAGDIAQADAAKDHDKQAIAAYVDRLKSDLNATHDRVGKAIQEVRSEPPAYAIVPYDGPNGTRRQPIYIECRNDAIVLQPEGIELNEHDFDGPKGPGNPLASTIRAARDYLAGGTAPTPGREPYPLLIVRSDGIVGFYLARSAMSSWASDFGYELIEADRKLIFQAPDPQLAQVEKAALTDARARYAWFATTRTGQEQQEPHEQPVYRVAGTGGIKREGEASLADADGVSTGLGTGTSGFGNPGSRFGAAGTGGGFGGTGTGNGGSGNGNGNGAGATGGTVAGGPGGGPAYVPGSNYIGLSGAGGPGGSGYGTGGPGYGTGGSPGGVPGGLAGGTGNGSGVGSGLGNGSSGGTGFTPGNGYVGLPGSGGQSGSGYGTGGTPGGVPGGLASGPGSGTGNGYIGLPGSGGPSGSGYGTGGAVGGSNGGPSGIAGGPVGNGNGNSGPGFGGPGGGTGYGTTGGSNTGYTVMPGSGGMNGSGSPGAPGGNSSAGYPAGGMQNTGYNVGSSLSGTNASGNPNGGNGAQGSNLPGGQSAPAGATGSMAGDPNSMPPPGTPTSNVSIGQGGSAGGPSGAPDGGDAAPGGMSLMMNNASQSQHSASDIYNINATPYPVQSGPTGPHPGEYVPTPDPVTYSDKPKPPADNAAKSHDSLAEKRGHNWSLPSTSKMSTPVSRTIHIECRGDCLILKPDFGNPHPRTIAFGPRTADSVDKLVAAVWDYTKGWGIAGRQMYWKPRLELELGLSGEGRYSELQALLSDSGLEVARKQSTPSVTQLR